MKTAAVMIGSVGLTFAVGYLLKTHLPKVAATIKA